MTKEIKGGVLNAWLYSALEEGLNPAGRKMQVLQKEYVVIDPLDETHTVHFNPLETMPGISSEELAEQLKIIFWQIWRASWGPKMENLLLNSFIALAEAGLTLADLNNFLSDQDFRSKALAKVKNQVCLDSFYDYDAASGSEQRTWAAPIKNKINALLEHPKLHEIFSHPKSTFNFRDILDNGKVLIVNLNKGRLGDNAWLLGSLLISKLQMAALSRTDVEEEKRRKFYLYVDEFDNFATDSFIPMLTETRKFGLFLRLAHQQLAQLSDRLMHAILGNSYVQFYFKLNHDDAQILAKEGLNTPYYEPPKDEWPEEPEDEEDDFAGNVARHQEYSREMDKYISRWENDPRRNEPYRLCWQPPPQRVAMLQGLKTQECVFRTTFNGNQDPVKIRVLDKKSAWSLFGEELKEIIITSRMDKIIGEDYVRPRSKQEQPQRNRYAEQQEYPESFRDPIDPADSGMEAAVEDEDDSAKE